MNVLTKVGVFISRAFEEVLDYSLTASLEGKVFLDCVKPVCPSLDISFSTEGDFTTVKVVNADYDEVIVTADIRYDDMNDMVVGKKYLDFVERVMLVK